MGEITGNGTAVTGLGGAAGFGETALARGDDLVTKVDVSAVFGAGFTLGGVQYGGDQLYISTDGLVSFGAGRAGISPPAAPFLAIFNADVDTRLDGEGAESGAVWLDADTARDCVTITWDHVGFYRRNANLTDTFQMQLFDRGNGRFDVVYRYQDISWTSGDLQGGWGGLGGTAAKIGTRAGAHGAAVLLAASGNEAAQLALDTGLGNTGVTGLWVMSFGGSPPIDGTNGADHLAGTNGADILRGLAGHDVLMGSGGADFLYGGPCKDQLAGGRGTDTISGGVGADVFVFAGTGKNGHDWITDYDAAAGDILNFGRAGAVRTDFVVTYVSDPGAGLAGVQEAHITYLPTGKLIWVLVDGAGEASLMVHSSMNSFDLS